MSSNGTAAKDALRARAVRVDDELWSAALDAATRNGETVSDVIRAALGAYVARSQRTRPTSAPAVSRCLRAAGFRPVPTSTRREGIRVQRSIGDGVTAAVTITCDWDDERQAESVAADVAAALDSHGFMYRHDGTARLVVTGRQDD